jgi:hypothetical protein
VKKAAKVVLPIGSDAEEDEEKYMENATAEI